MTVRVRPAIVLTALAAAVAPAAVAVLLSGSATSVSLPAVPVTTTTATATATTATTAATGNTVAAEIIAAPQAVALAASAVSRPAAKRTTAVRLGTVHTARSNSRQVAVAPTAVTPAAAPKPVAAPKPAPTATTTSSTRTGDDYPYAAATTSDNDAWGFTKRQCVSFAAFRLSQHGHTLNNNTQGWGSALSWDEAAPRNGAAVSSTPKVGAIAQWNAGESSRIYTSTGAPKGSFSAGSYGHVGYVAAVYSDGTVLVEQYNLGGDRSYSAMRMSAPRYLVF